MKFLSKHSHFRLVLRPSIPENLMAGRVGVPGLNILFQDGMATVNDLDVIKLLLAHPQYNNTFTAVKDEEEAALLAKAPNSEPEHDLSDIEYGHVGAAKNPKKGVNLTPELKKIITDEAVRIALEIIKANDAKKEAKDSVEETPPVIQPAKKSKTVEKTVSE